jgi:hypothetical protein
MRDCCETFGRSEWFRCTESTANGWPHYHLLQRGPFIPFKWLRENWLRLTGTPRVQIKPVTDGKVAAGYVTAYVAKGNPMEFTSRRFSHSRGWWLDPPKLPKSQSDWQKIEMSARDPVSFIKDAFPFSSIDIVSPTFWMIKRSKSERDVEAFEREAAERKEKAETQSRSARRQRAGRKTRSQRP